MYADGTAFITSFNIIKNLSSYYNDELKLINNWLFFNNNLTSLLFFNISNFSHDFSLLITNKNINIKLKQYI